MGGFYAPSYINSFSFKIILFILVFFENFTYLCSVKIIISDYMEKEFILCAAIWNDAPLCYIHC